MHKLCYMALGGLLMFIGMLTASLLMPNLVAQRDKFGEIECTGLSVVNGGSIWLWDKNVASAAQIGTDEMGGYVTLYGKSTDGKRSKSKIMLFIDDPGGAVQISGKGEGKVGIGINEYGNGAVSTWDKNGYRQ